MWALVLLFRVVWQPLRVPFESLTSLMYRRFKGLRSGSSETLNPKPLHH